MLVILSGPSGVGKDTIIDELQRRERVSGNAGQRHYVVTVTTRAPREGEVDGIDYHFVHARSSCGSGRGVASSRPTRSTATGTARRATRSGRRSPPAAMPCSRSMSRARATVKDQVSEALLIFVIPPSLETLFARLRARATETADELELRQRNAALELARQEDYDYVVTNETGQVERTAERIEAIIADEHRRDPGRRVRV